MSAITFFYAPQSRAVRVQRLLEVLDIPHEVKTIDLQSQQHKQPEYLKVHPLGQVPALQHGKHVVIESGAIMMYLADLFPEKDMAPRVGTIERGFYYHWFFVFLSTIEPMVISIMEDRENQQKRENLRNAFLALDSTLIGPFLTGEQFTAVDVLAHCDLFWMQQREIFPKGLSKWEEYYQAAEQKYQSLLY